MSSIGYTNKEFQQLLQYLTPEIPIAPTGRPYKLTIEERLFMLLWFLHFNDTMRAMEYIFCFAHSSITEDLPFVATILLVIIKRELGELWPNAAERTLLASFLPDCLQGTGLIGFADSTKQTVVDSVYKPIRQRFWNDHKGYGPNHLHIVDLFGNTISDEVCFDGYEGDMAQWRAGDVYNLRNNKLFSPNETLAGDSHYVGNLTISMYSTDFFRKHTAPEITNLPTAELQLLAYEVTISLHQPDYLSCTCLYYIIYIQITFN